MTLDYTALANTPRLLIEAKLKPLQGHRFQSTGFADLGPARYTLHDGTEMLLVESVQSVANRMELACCGEDRRVPLAALSGLPYVQSTQNGEVLTTSFLEAHRLSSPYLLNEEWAKKLAAAFALRDEFALNDRNISKAVFKYDPASLLHGVWLSLQQFKGEFSGGRVRVTRALSGFIEASGVKPAEHGGTKFDKNSARNTEDGDATTGYGTLPYHRSDFTAKEVKAFFNLDLALLRGYGLGEDATKLLIALSLFKVCRFLSTGLRLRTACDLEVDGSVVATRPVGFKISTESALLEECTTLIARCAKAGQFATPPITEIKYTPTKAKKKPATSEVSSDDQDEDE